ncbi:tRNA(Ile)-lysidine synthetase [Candidatus Acetothermia bacterium]|nr:MAG: tRNA(Ile)-lysidine synthetase [Candidatus Acetothermia bacterium]
MEKEVAEASRRFRMLAPEERVLVAVSGGKDSLALWHILAKLGYQVDGLYIDLGIAGYSDRSQEASQAFARERGLTLHVVSLAGELGAGLDELVRLARGKTCSLCGTVKRYLMNRLAWEGGYHALATGHNLDDEAATLLGNVLRWDEGYLARQYPVLPGEGKLVRKIKPLVFLSEREMAAYCLIEGIRYLYEDCPHAQGARSIVLKGVLNELEDRYPSTKISFLRQFLKVQARFRPPEPVELHDCPGCGMPTAAAGLCRFCRLKERVSHGAAA